MIRALSVLLGVTAAFAGALLAFDVMRAVGPGDITGLFGHGAAANAASIARLDPAAIDKLVTGSPGRT